MLDGLPADAHSIGYVIEPRLHLSRTCSRRQRLSLLSLSGVHFGLSEQVNRHIGTLPAS